MPLSLDQLLLITQPLTMKINNPGIRPPSLVTVFMPFIMSPRSSGKVQDCVIKHKSQNKGRLMDEMVEINTSSLDEVNVLSCVWTTTVSIR